MLADNGIDPHRALPTIDHAAWVLNQHRSLCDDTAMASSAKVAVSNQGNIPRPP